MYTNSNIYVYHFGIVHCKNLIDCGWEMNEWMNQFQLPILTEQAKECRRIAEQISFGIKHTAKVMQGWPACSARIKHL